MGGIKMPIPPSDEQKTIARFLDMKCATIDATTSILETQISTLERYRASVIHEAVTRGLDPTAPHQTQRRRLDRRSSEKLGIEPHEVSGFDGIRRNTK